MKFTSLAVLLVLGCASLNAQNAHYTLSASSAFSSDGGMQFGALELGFRPKLTPAGSIAAGLQYDWSSQVKWNFEAEIGHLSMGQTFSSNDEVLGYDRMRVRGRIGGMSYGLTFGQDISGPHLNARRQYFLWRAGINLFTENVRQFGMTAGNLNNNVDVHFGFEEDYDWSAVLNPSLKLGYGWKFGEKENLHHCFEVYGSFYYLNLPKRVFEVKGINTQNQQVYFSYESDSKMNAALLGVSYKLVLKNRTIGMKNLTP